MKVRYSGGKQQRKSKYPLPAVLSLIKSGYLSSDKNKCKTTISAAKEKTNSRKYSTA